MVSSLRKVALTGGIASGKSLAAGYLTARQIPVIDADVVVHDLLRQDSGLQANIRSEFGTDVFDSDGSLNRKRLGEKVFADAPKRKLLESWIHPRVREAIQNFFVANRNHPLAVAMIPLLFETNTERNYDEVWLLESDREKQIERMITTRNMSRQDALARINSQMSADEKRRRAQALPNAKVLTNNGSPDDLYRQLDALL